jgi:hypothetical protein
MGFIQGVTAGAAIRDRNRDLYRPTNPALSYAAITQEPQAMRGHNQLGTPPEDQPMGMNPSAIHRRAAEMVLQEKEMDLQKTALEVERMREANAMAKDTRRRAIEAEPFQKSKMIEDEYQGRLKGIEADEKMTRDRKDRVQAEDFKQAMLAAHMGDGEGVKNFINKHGDPNTNVDRIDFSPDGSGQVLVTPSGQDKDGKPKKPMLFESPEQLYKGLLFWMDPQSAKVIAERNKGTKKGEDEDKLVKTRNVIRKGLETEYDKKYNPTGMGLEPNAPDRDTWMREQYQEITGKDWDTEIEEKGKKGAIQPPKVAGEKGADVGKQAVKGADMSGDKPPIEGAVKSPKDGNWYVKGKNGKWNLIEAEGTSIATEKSKTPAGGQRVKGKMPEKDGGAIKGKVKKKSVGTTTFTDKKTGEKVNRTYYADGSFDEERQQIH